MILITTLHFQEICKGRSIQEPDSQLLEGIYEREIPEGAYTKLRRGFDISLEVFYVRCLINGE
jgi:hypothetical protein